MSYSAEIGESEDFVFGRQGSVGGEGGPALGRDSASGIVGLVRAHDHGGHEPRQVRPDGAQVPAVRQPPVEGTRNDLATHRVTH